MNSRREFIKSLGLAGAMMGFSPLQLAYSQPNVNYTQELCKALRKFQKSYPGHGSPPDLEVAASMQAQYYFNIRELDREYLLYYTPKEESGESIEDKLNVRIRLYNAPEAKPWAEFEVRDNDGDGSIDDVSFWDFRNPVTMLIHKKKHELSDAKVYQNSYERAAYLFIKMLEEKIKPVSQTQLRN